MTQFPCVLHRYFFCLLRRCFKGRSSEEGHLADNEMTIHIGSRIVTECNPVL